MGYFFRGFAWTWGKIFALVSAHLVAFVLILLVALFMAWHQKRKKRK